MCERQKEVQCEITCLEFKTGGAEMESLKLLVFKFSKNDKNDKKKGMTYGLNPSLDDEDIEEEEEKEEYGDHEEEDDGRERKVAFADQ